MFPGPALYLSIPLPFGAKDRNVVELASANELLARLGRETAAPEACSSRERNVCGTRSSAVNYPWKSTVPGAKQPGINELQPLKIIALSMVTEVILLRCG